jgi:hydrogenase expression/formation protein HypC
MCLAIPGEVIRWLQREVPFCEAEVRFSGVVRKVNMMCVPEVDIGEYVIVHAGIAISKMDANAAAELLASISDMEIEEWRQGLSQ